MAEECRVSAAADLLWEHWQQGRRMAALPETLRPRTREDGYAIQAALAMNSAAPLFGWKIAATSRAGQLHINVDGPLAGRLLRERVFETGAEVPFGANHMRVAEAEFAFRMGRDLTPRQRPYHVDEVLAAVAALHPAIEIPDSRFDDFTLVGAAQLIADNACAHYFVLGPETTADWRSLDLVEHAVTATVWNDRSGVWNDRSGGPSGPPDDAGKGVHVHGKGGNVLGDPRIALAWLANELSSLGLTLRTGEVVTTGTCIVPPAIAPGDRFEADFGALGRIDVRVGA
jgi:2-keto-4-pentenoate hydratase